MAHGTIPMTKVKLKHHGWGSRSSGKRKNWSRRNEPPSKFRAFMQKAFGRPILSRSKIV